VIRPEHIQFELANEGEAGGLAPGMGSGAEASLAGSLVQAERDLILDALRNHQGSRREAAEHLGISPRTLRYKLARLRDAGIDVPAA
jgi:two-component system response regulator FlrC